MAGFILANGALSGGGEEYKIRRKLIENNLVEAILVLPRNLFYTTDISVTLWILNKNKTAQSKNIGDVKRQLRNREKEILFMDLRQMGEPFEKKFTQFSEADIKKVAETFHNWQQGIMVNEKGDNNINNSTFTINNYNVPEYCYAAKLEEITAKDFSLVPSKYIEFVNRDENIDFDEKMTSLKGEFAELLKAEEQSKKDLLEVFKTLGYEL
jgi:type I restriction enzyme M protein